MAKKAAIIPYIPPVLEKQPKAQPRIFAEVDKELKYGGLAYLKQKAEELNTTITHDLGEVSLVDGDIVKAKLVVEPSGAWKYNYGQ